MVSRSVGGAKIWFLKIFMYFSGSEGDVVEGGGKVFAKNKKVADKEYISHVG